MDITLLAALGTAFLGGIILNVMPCVLPVLTMKVFHMVEQTDATPRQNRLHGLAYTGGILVAMGIFAGIVISLKAGQEMIQWGMQFKNPAFVGALTLLMFVFGLNALGVFEFTVSTSGSKKEGYSGSFINGIVATIMATPCSAPFLGSAVVFAFAAGTPAWATALMFMGIGLGLAFPFLLVSFVPAAGRLLPRPGAWMETFKQAMGFSLLAAAVWLYGVLLEQVTPASAHWFLALMLATGVGLWAIERFGGLRFSTLRRMTVRAVSIGLVVAFGMRFVSFDKKDHDTVEMVSCDWTPLKTVDGDHKINWAPFSESAVAMAKKQNRPVFMDYSAEWCMNCKTNEKMILETDTVRSALSDTNILPIRVDMTNENDVMERWLDDLGRSGIPAYAIYFPDGTVDLLPEVITPGMVAEHLSSAAQKYPEDGYTSLAEACLAKVIPTVEPTSAAN